MAKPEGRYAAETRVTVAEVPGLRVRLLALGPGQNVPWHRHTEITDTFFCLAGPMQVHTREPDCIRVLEPGGSCAVEPGRAHAVRGVDGGACRFLAVQGVGVYDYVQLEA